MIWLAPPAVGSPVESRSDRDLRARPALSGRAERCLPKRSTAATQRNARITALSMRLRLLPRCRRDLKRRPRGISARSGEPGSPTSYFLCQPPDRPQSRARSLRLVSHRRAGLHQGRHPDRAGDRGAIGIDHSAWDHTGYSPAGSGPAACSFRNVSGDVENGYQTGAVVDLDLIWCPLLPLRSATTCPLRPPCGASSLP